MKIKYNETVKTVFFVDEHGMAVSREFSCIDDVLIDLLDHYLNARVKTFNDFIDLVNESRNYRLAVKSELFINSDEYCDYFLNQLCTYIDSEGLLKPAAFVVETQYDRYKGFEYMVRIEITHLSYMSKTYREAVSIIDQLYRGNRIYKTTRIRLLAKLNIGYVLERSGFTVKTKPRKDLVLLSHNQLFPGRVFTIKYIESYLSTMAKYYLFGNIEQKMDFYKLQKFSHHLELESRDSQFPRLRLENQYLNRKFHSYFEGNGVIKDEFIKAHVHVGRDGKFLSSFYFSLPEYYFEFSTHDRFSALNFLLKIEKGKRVNQSYIDYLRFKLSRTVTALDN
jgi:hypothetical protein